MSVYRLGSNRQFRPKMEKFLPEEGSSLQKYINAIYLLLMKMECVKFERQDFSVIRRALEKLVEEIGEFTKRKFPCIDSEFNFPTEDDLVSVVKKNITAAAKVASRELKCVLLNLEKADIDRAVEMLQDPYERLKQYVQASKTPVFSGMAVFMSSFKKKNVIHYLSGSFLDSFVNCILFSFLDKDSKRALYLYAVIFSAADTTMR